uniref:DGQHR domain-containing protein n=1 Tax=Panagrolaimus superbus TaxID=310955 RepID=A0A914YKF3_9BILA
MSGVNALSNHIKYLIRRLEESNEEDRRKIIYHTLMVGYQSDEGNGVIVVIDGNHRILAIKKWNEKHPNDPIQHLYFDIILTSKPSLFAAVHICNFSAQEAERDMLPYSRSDVIRLARQLLMEEPSLGLSDIVEAKQTKQRALETDLVSTLAPILNVDKDKIPCIVWKLTRIQNEDFEKVLPGISSFTTNKQISKSVTSYERRQKATIEILSKAEAGSDLEMKIDSLTGKDWAFILREKNIWHFGHDEDAHLQVIMGTRYSNIKNKDKAMEAFLLSGFAKGVSNYKRYPNAKAKRRYLKQQFEKWIQSQPLPTAVPDNRTSEIIFDQATLGGGGNAGVKAEIITIGSDKPPSTAKPTNTRAKNTLVLKNIKISDAKEKYVDMFENTILKKEMAAFASYMLSDMSKNKGDFSSHEAVSSCTPFIIRQGDFDIQKFLNSIKKAVEDDAAAKST